VARQGVLPMLRRLLHDFGVPQRLLAAGDERTLTDLLHLAELLQQASALLEASTRCAPPRRAARGRQHRQREPQLRLESDADLVKVVTVHKSKGLEYPLVFLPFACFRGREADGPAAQVARRRGPLQLALRAEPTCWNARTTSAWAKTCASSTWR
jgi:exodeoxyribonuclease V beta subunit